MAPATKAGAVMDAANGPLARENGEVPDGRGGRVRREVGLTCPRHRWLLLRSRRDRSFAVLLARSSLDIEKGRIVDMWVCVSAVSRGELRSRPVGDAGSSGCHAGLGENPSVDEI